RATTVRPTGPHEGGLLAAGSSVPAEVPVADDDRLARQVLELEVRRLGTPVTTLRAKVAADDDDSLHRLLVAAIKRQGGLLAEIEDYELVVRTPGAAEILATYVSCMRA